jgi:hypothetical protein
MFGKKTITCPAGQWTTIIRSRFAQLPASWDIHLRSEGGDVAGEFEEKKSAWVFPGQPVCGQLRERLSFERGYWNTFYSVRIRPRTAVTAEIR